MEHLRHLGQELFEAGCRHVFGIPGSGPSLTVLDAYERHGGDFVLTHFEGAGAIMAGAMGRLTGRAGACVSIKGPGLANMASGLASSLLDACPVVSIAEAVPPGAPPHAAHKRMDHRGLVSAVAKEMHFLGTEGLTFADLAERARQECPGPVHLEICAKPVSDQGEAVFVRAECNRGKMGECLKRLEASRRPLVIAGSLAVRLGLSPLLAALRVPVFTTVAAKGLISEFLPHSAGVYTGAGLDLAPEKHLIHEADLIVGIGLRHNEVLGGFPLPVESINFDSLGDSFWSGFGFTHGADPGHDWSPVFDLLGSRDWGAEHIADLLLRMRQHLLQDGDMPANVFAEVEQRWGKDVRLVMDTGIYCTVGEHIWRAGAPELCLGSGQGRYMGVGLPQAIAAAMHDGTPCAPTVLFAGDGGLMYLPELKTAVARKLPLVVILLSDGGFGTLRGRCLREKIGQKPLTFPRPSWAAVMEGLGLPSTIAHSPEAVAAALPDRVDGPVFVEISFDPDRYAHMTDALR